MNTTIHSESNKAYQALYAMEHEIRVALAEEINLSTSGTDISHREYWLRQALKNVRTANTFLTRAGSAYNSANLRDVTDRS